MRVLFLFVALTFVVCPSALAKKVYNRDYIGELIIHKAVFEDTLIHLARGNALGFVELRAANPTLDPWIPGAGARITLPTQHILPEAPREGLVINLAEMRVFYFKTPGEAPLTFPISIGREGLQTPTGTTKIVRKKAGPTWRPTERMKKEDPELPDVVPPGPDNPLGTHALYLGWPQYALHGTNKPYGIGRRVSSGCIRLYPEHIKELFPLVPVGTKVSVVDQPVKVGWIGQQMYVEVHPTQDQAIKIEEDGVLESYEITTQDMKRITAKAGVHADKINWAIVRRAVQEHRGFPIAVLDIARNPGRRAQSELDKMLDQAGAKDKEIAQIKNPPVEELAQAEPEVKAPVSQGRRKSISEFFTEAEIKSPDFND
ncbi:MAG: L,D-transpeptidase family protein [Alphaproteobacteria bacterium]|nr:L,D-transpeptidase family protein [Alphaproteobacteria bacterium]